MCICIAVNADPESAVRVGASYALRRHEFLFRSGDPKACPVVSSAGASGSNCFQQVGSLFWAADVYL